MTTNGDDAMSTTYAYPLHKTAYYTSATGVDITIALLCDTDARFSAMIVDDELYGTRVIGFTTEQLMPDVMLVYEDPLDHRVLMLSDDDDLIATITARFKEAKLDKIEYSAQVEPCDDEYYYRHTYLED